MDRRVDLAGPRKQRTAVAFTAPGSKSDPSYRKFAVTGKSVAGCAVPPSPLPTRFFRIATNAWARNGEQRLGNYTWREPLRFSGMSARGRLVLLVIALLAFAATVLAAIAASAGDDGPAAVVEEIDAAGVVGPRSPYEGAVRPKTPPGDFALRNQDGELVRLADLRGTVVVLSPTSTPRAPRPVRSRPSRSGAPSTTSRRRSGTASARSR